MIDSGASMHTTSRMEFFTSYMVGDFGIVKMDNEGIAKVVDIGDVCLETNNGTRLALKHVKHISDIRLNLISTSKLDDNGFGSIFSNDQWKLTKGAIVVVRGNKSSTLYLLYVKLSKDVINAVENVRETELWHHRLSQISEKGMALLVKKNLLHGMKSIYLQKCTHCLAEK